MKVNRNAQQQGSTQEATKSKTSDVGKSSKAEVATEGSLLSSVSKTVSKLDNYVAGGLKQASRALGLTPSSSKTGGVKRAPRGTTPSSKSASATQRSPLAAASLNSLSSATTARLDDTPRTQSAEATTHQASFDSSAQRWEEMGPDKQQQWGKLGWNQNNWENGPAPSTVQTPWNQLSGEQRSAATALGQSEQSWNAPTEWNHMKPHEQANWGKLGWDQQNWENGPTPPSAQKDWGQLNTTEQQAATALGYTEPTWNREDIPVTTPDGVDYTPNKPRVSNETKLPNDSGQILDNFTQQNGPAGGKERCGPAVVVAAAVQAEGKEGAAKLAENLAKTSPADMKRQYEAIAQKLRSGDATYGDLGELSALIHKDYGMPTFAPDGSEVPGSRAVDGTNMGILMTTPPIQSPQNTQRWSPETSWPMKININNDGQDGNHWVLVRRDSNGQTQVWDPMSKSGPSQQGTAASGQQYVNRMQQQILQARQNPNVNPTSFGFPSRPQ